MAGFLVAFWVAVAVSATSWWDFAHGDLPLEVAATRAGVALLVAWSLIALFGLLVDLMAPVDPDSPAGTDNPDRAGLA